MEKVLHLGSGQKRIKEISVFKDMECEEVTMDIDPSCSPDICSDIRVYEPSLKNTFDWIVAEHFLEHFEEHEVDTLLDISKEYLKDTGKVYFRVPDLEAVMSAALKHGLDKVLYTCGIGDVTARDVLYGHSDLLKRGHIYYKHKTGFTVKTLKKKLEARGYENVKMYRSPLNYEVLAIGEKNGSSR